MRRGSQMKYQLDEASLEYYDVVQFYTPPNDRRADGSNSKVDLRSNQDSENEINLLGTKNDVEDKKPKRTSWRRKVASKFFSHKAPSNAKHHITSKPNNKFDSSSNANAEWDDDQSKTRPMSTSMVPSNPIEYQVEDFESNPWDKQKPRRRMYSSSSHYIPSMVETFFKDPNRSDAVSVRSCSTKYQTEKGNASRSSFLNEYNEDEIDSIYNGEHDDEGDDAERDSEAIENPDETLKQASRTTKKKVSKKKLSLINWVNKRLFHKKHDSNQKSDQDLPHAARACEPTYASQQLSALRNSSTTISSNLIANAIELQPATNGPIRLEPVPDKPHKHSHSNDTITSCSSTAQKHKDCIYDLYGSEDDINALNVSLLYRHEVSNHH